MKHGSESFNLLVGALIVHQGDLLLTQRSMKEKFMPGAWGIPAGKIDHGEAPADALQREVREETGLVNLIDVVLVGFSQFMSEKSEHRLHNLQLNFKATSECRDVVLDESSQDFKWVSLDELRELDLDEFTTTAVDQLVGYKGYPA